VKEKPGELRKEKEKEKKALLTSSTKNSEEKGSEEKGGKHQPPIAPNVARILGNEKK